MPEFRERVAPEVEQCKALRALSTKGSGGALKLPQRGRGEAPAVNDFERALIEFSIRNLQFEKIFICCQHTSIIQHTHTLSLTLRYRNLTVSGSDECWRHKQL